MHASYKVQDWWYPNSKQTAPNEINAWCIFVSASFSLQRNSISDQAAIYSPWTRATTAIGKARYSPFLPTLIPEAAPGVAVVEVAAPPDAVGDPEPVGLAVVIVEFPPVGAAVPVGAEVPVGVLVELPPLLPLYWSTMN